MIENIWNLLEYEGRVKIIKKNGKVHTGKIILIEDVDEDDDYIDECLFIDCDGDDTWAVFVHEIEDIILFDVL